jgi:hypothetical protein
MKIACFSCEALTRSVYLSAAYSPHQVDVMLLRMGLHNTPLNLRARLQAAIDAITSPPYDAIVLAYGLCGQATAGLVARQIPLVIPRAHDCITLFLGSRARYQEEFAAQPGTYWYVQDYMERRDGTGTTLSLGAGLDVNIGDVYDEYVAKYGQDNADYLMEVMGGWQAHYQRAVYIDMGVGDGASIERQAQEEAARRGWCFQRQNGDLNLLRRLLAGEWDQDFLVIQPGQQIAVSYDEGVVTCQDRGQETTDEPQAPN